MLVGKHQNPGRERPPLFTLSSIAFTFGVCMAITCDGIMYPPRGVILSFRDGKSISERTFIENKVHLMEPDG